MAADAAEIKRAVTDLYDRVADEYGQIGPPLFTHAGRRLVELADLRTGDRVLDVASGRGASIMAASAKVGRTGHVVGIDLSAGMVRATRQALLRAGVANAEVREMDAEVLLFPDGSFDVALCGFAVFLFPHLDRALDELRRVLRPGGLAGFVHASGNDPRWDWYDRALVAEDVLLSLNPSGERQPLEEVLAEHRFADVRVQEEPLEGVFHNTDDWWSWQWTHGARIPLEHMTPDQLAAFQQRVMERVRTMREPDGIHQTWTLRFILARNPG